MPVGPDARAVVVIASAGRPHLLRTVIGDVDALTGDGIEKVLSVPDAASLPDGVGEGDGWRIVTGTRGLAAQRNAAMDTLRGDPVVFFFDDDATIRRDYVVNALAFFGDHPSVVGVTGRVLLDGAVSGEVPVETARAALAASSADPRTGAWTRARELYGCNFAVRTSGAPGLRFDSRLPLYSWLEDHDFARRLMPYGVLAKVDDCVIVHRAAASGGGRQAHERLGYSQVMNPYYLWRKGSFPFWLLLNETIKRVAKNLVYSVGGSEREWRRRRVHGNALACADIVRRRITPERIAEL
ncbi:glycosyltransferase family 2 protein [uncultured Amnibacterium sp.]|uniref:glycosyltransferase family 2 protein n=1 Tax=uncultured Amnibacterium sp. TaxID=1631851 RepID=UPI0035CA4C4A